MVECEDFWWKVLHCKSWNRMVWRFGLVGKPKPARGFRQQWTHALVINGHSGMGSNAFAHPPVWDFQSSLWMARGGPPLNTQQPARALDMQEMVDDYYQQCMYTVWQPDTGWVDLSIPPAGLQGLIMPGAAMPGEAGSPTPSLAMVRDICRRQQGRHLKEKVMPIPADLACKG